jgi:hypothetical protein
MPSRIALVLLTAATATAQTNVVDQLASLFAFTPETLRVCADGAATATIFSDALNSTLTATRACFALELTRERLDECIDKSASTLRLITSPYDVFSVHALSSTDITKLGTCASGVENTATAILDPFQVLLKRFLQCNIDLTKDGDVRTAVLDTFEGTGAIQELNRAQLAAICTSLHFSGSLHSDVVDFFSQTLRHFVALVPARRR